MWWHAAEKSAISLGETGVVTGTRFMSMIYHKIISSALTALPKGTKCSGPWDIPVVRWQLKCPKSGVSMAWWPGLRLPGIG
jgi:hypothetical protein